MIRDYWTVVEMLISLWIGFTMGALYMALLQIARRAEYDTPSDR